MAQFSMEIMRLTGSVLRGNQQCYRYSAKLNDENEQIADLLIGLTRAKKTWGFSLCFLYLRNVRGHRWNHKVAGVRDAIEAAGAGLIYLPPYSPDFKALLRAAAARTIPDLWQAIADAIKQFKPDECRNYFQAAGYDAF